MSKMRVWKNTDSHYRVESETTPNQFYRVRIVGDLGVCTCPHFTNRNIDECKHIERVKEAQETGDYIDRTELKELRNDIAEIHRMADEAITRIRHLEGGWKPSSCW